MPASGRLYFLTAVVRKLIATTSVLRLREGRFIPTLPTSPFMVLQARTASCRATSTS